MKLKINWRNLVKLYVIVYAGMLVYYFIYRDLMDTNKFGVVWGALVGLISTFTIPPITITSSQKEQ